MGPMSLVRISVALVTLGLLTGCAPKQFAKYPQGSLRVAYEESSSYSGCLVACTAMAANYLTDQRKLSEKGIRESLKMANLDETRVADVKAWLETQGLYLLTLSGTLDGKPPASLGYWLCQRGYPVICVINRHENDVKFNHAVVVIGFTKTAGDETADRIHYLDPASAKVLHSEDRKTFETLWARGEHAMMMVIAPPQEPGTGSAQ
ncbi:MAG: hypothetical protein KA354_09830 [Phycisphaerae bacterium]|nr:hypothetical protein [Phycisphaerae bacterium]